MLFEPWDVLARRAARVTPPRIPLTGFHGVFAPASRLRAAVTPAGGGRRRCWPAPRCRRQAACITPIRRTARHQRPQVLFLSSSSVDEQRSKRTHRLISGAILLPTAQVASRRVRGTEPRTLWDALFLGLF